MVAHQRRLHQERMNSTKVPSIHASDLQDNEPLSTLQQSPMTWSPPGVVSVDKAMSNDRLHHTASHAEFNQKLDEQNISQRCTTQHDTISWVHLGFLRQPILNYDLSASPSNLTSPMPFGTCRVTKQGNQHVEMMANATQPYYQVLQPAERYPIESLNSTSAITASVQSSPRTPSVISVPGPVSRQYLNEYVLEAQPDYRQAHPVAVWSTNRSTRPNHYQYGLQEAISRYPEALG